MALSCLSVLSVGWLISRTSETEDVLALATSVPRGSVIDESALTAVSINPDPGLKPVPVANKAQIVGQRAAYDLVEGTLLTDTAVTEQVLPAEGENIVGVAVTPAQVPRAPLRPGDAIRVVDTPVAQADPPLQNPAAIKAIVVSVDSIPDTGQIVIDVLVPSDDANALIARVATGRIGIAIEPRER